MRDISAMQAGDMRVEYVRQRMVTNEANERAEQVGALLAEIYDDMGRETAVDFCRRFIADTYEIAWGRGYDAAVDDDGGGPPLITLPPARPGDALRQVLRDYATSVRMHCGICGESVFLDLLRDPVKIRPMHENWQGKVYDHDAAPRT
jgi:hypothetical protein